MEIYSWYTHSSWNENGRTVGSVFTGYTLTGTVTVRSNDIGKVEKLSREITNLLEKGIEFSSTPPSYYYSKLNDLKINKHIISWETDPLKDIYRIKNSCR